MLFLFDYGQHYVLSSALLMLRGVPPSRSPSHLSLFLNAQEGGGPGGLGGRMLEANFLFLLLLVGISESCTANAVIDG